MAKISQVGPGRKTVGTIDGITYVTRGGVTYARSAPTMPARVFNTPAAKKRQAIFKLIQMHVKLHLRTIRQTITPDGNGTACNRYLSLNYKGLSAALDALADSYVAGTDVTITDIEAAISVYAVEHPTSIRIASLSGYQEVYLAGEWPATITLNALEGDSTVIIIVNEHGVQTTIAADGTVTTGQYTGGNSGSGVTVNGEGSGENQNQNGGGTEGSSGSSGSSGGSSDSNGANGSNGDSNGSNAGTNGSEQGNGGSSNENLNPGTNGAEGNSGTSGTSEASGDFTITAAVGNDGGGSVSIKKNGVAVEGSSVQASASDSIVLTAVEESGYQFLGWADGNSDNPRTITPSADATFTASFMDLSNV